MPRDTQYQPAGNPLQTSRLPKTRPTLAFPYHPMKPEEESQLCRRILFLMAPLSAGAMIAQLFQISAQAGLTRSFLLSNAILLAPASFIAARMLSGARNAGQRAALSCLGLAFVYFNWPPPLSGHLLVFALSMSLLTWLIGRHWIAYCTASPVSREAARSLSETLTGFLLLMATVPIGLFVAAQFLTISQLLCLLVVIPVVQFALLFVALDGKWNLSAAWSALASWLTYNPQDADVPGTLASPAGQWPHRMAYTACCVTLSAITIIRVSLEATASEAVPTAPFAAILDALNSARPEQLAEDSSALDFAGLWLVWLVAVVFAPVPLAIGGPLVLLLPLLINAAQYRPSEVGPEEWQSITAEMRESSDPIERDSDYSGRLACDNSPVLVHSKTAKEHRHFLGDSGGGKTSLGLCPTIEQFAARGDSSIVCIDLKGDSHELFASVLAGVECGRKRSGLAIPLKFLTTKPGLPTFAFNALDQPFCRSLGLYGKTDLLCGALGLTYGADYAEGYYSSANSAVVYETMRQFPNVSTFWELADRVGYVLANAKKTELHPETRKSGNHVQTVLRRLGTTEPLNVKAGGGYPEEVVDQAIDLTQVFAEPQAIYCQLSTVVSPAAAPEIARLVVYSLLAAATQAERRCQVYLVIDEFQRMVAQNLEYMLQLARSMGVGIILANQSMEDLRSSRSNLIPTIEINCRYRQWFSVSSVEDRKRLIDTGGETVEPEITRTYTRNQHGPQESISVRERVVPRLTDNDILLASDHPQQSVLRISRGEGYAQYGGMPVIVQSEFHISKEEYERRVKMPWPENVPGTFVPRLDDGNPPSGAAAAKLAAQPPPVGPTVTTEVIGAAEPSAPTTAPAGPTGDPVQTLFENQQEPTAPRRPRRRKTK